MGPAAVITKNSSASFGCEGAPLTCRVPEAWQVVLGVYAPSKPKRSDSPLQVQAPVPAQVSGSLRTAFFVPQYPRDSSLESHTVGDLGPGAQRILIIIINTYRTFTVCLQSLCKALCLTHYSLQELFEVSTIIPIVQVNTLRHRQLK